MLLLLIPFAIEGDNVMPLWSRHKDTLIELSLESSAAAADARQWGLRLEGETLELRTFDDSQYSREKVLIEREGTKIVRILVEGVVVWQTTK